MLEEISNFFTNETIYIWLNIGVIPFWLILIFFPNSSITSSLVTGLILEEILALGAASG